jgi:hypothetical protein
MATNLVTSQQQGASQFASALANSQSAVRSLLAGAGIRMPNGGTAGVGDAWDPAGFTPGAALTADQITSMTAGTSYGAEGGYSEAYQAGANVAADQAMQSRSRGLGKGGLASQRQELALMQTQSNAADVTKNLIAGVSGAYGDVNSAYVNEQERIAAEDAKTADLIAAGSVVNPEVAAPVAAPVAIQPGSVGPIVATSNRGNYVKKGTPRGPDVPKNPKPGRSYKGTGGVTFVYRSEGPKGPGWYHK